MDKQTKREIKKQNKTIFIFLAIAFPVMLVFVYGLITLFPGLKQLEWVVIALVVLLGLALYALTIFIQRKIEEKKAKQPKKKDPFAD